MPFVPNPPNTKPYKPPCNSPYHNPPSMLYQSPGIYTWICLNCGEKITYEVPGYSC